jgi:hypothetical protein
MPITAAFRQGRKHRHGACHSGQEETLTTFLQRTTSPYSSRLAKVTGNIWGLRAGAVAWTSGITPIVRRCASEWSFRI